MAKVGEEWTKVHVLMTEVEALAHNLEDKAHDLALGINADPAELLIFMDQVEGNFKNARAEIVKHNKVALV